MSVIAAAVKHLLAAGVTGDALVAAIAEMEANAAAAVDKAAENKRAYDREYRRKEREAKKDRTMSYDSHDIGDSGFPDKENPQTPKEINPSRMCEAPAPVHEGRVIPLPAKRPAKPVFVLPSDIPEDAWEAFDEMRRSGRDKHKWTDRAKQLAINRLRELAEAGHPPGDVLNQSTMRGYSGLFPISGDRNDQANRTNRSQVQRGGGFGSDRGGFAALLGAGSDR